MGRSNTWAAALAVTVLVCPALARAENSTAADRSDAAGRQDSGTGNDRRESADKADKADESFHAGRALLKDKRYADACPKFEESQRQDPASGTLLALAYCQELSGLLATSWTNYLAAAQLAEREGHSDRQSAAQERARSLTSRVSKLTVIVPSDLLGMPGFHLLRDGIEFERASIGVPVPTDGGSHAFVASAPGRVPWSSTVTLFAEHDQKVLVLPELDPVPSAQRESTVSTPPQVDARAARNETLSHVSLALAAGSVVSLGLGTAFAISANAKNNQSNAGGHCDAGCDIRGTELRKSALSAARASTWSFVAGGALAAASITLYLAADSSRARVGRGLRVEGNTALGAATVSFGGSF